MILRSFARNISAEAAVSTIISDIRQSNERSMDVKTYDDHMDALRDLFIIWDMEAWISGQRHQLEAPQRGIL